MFEVILAFCLHGLSLFLGFGGGGINLGHAFLELLVGFARIYGGLGDDLVQGCHGGIYLFLDVHDFIPEFRDAGADFVRQFVGRGVGGAPGEKQGRPGAQGQESEDSVPHIKRFHRYRMGMFSIVD